LRPNPGCRHPSIRTLSERFVSLGASWLFSLQPVLPPDFRPVYVNRVYYWYHAALEDDMKDQSVISIATLLLLFATVSIGQDVAKVDPQHYRVIFENSHIRVIRGRDKPGDKTPVHHHPAYLSIPDGPVKTKITLENGQTLIDGPSDAVWCSPPTTHATENIGTTNTNEIIVEFKDYNPCDDSSAGKQELK
jgi:beta-alanine degradation protein BauB